jgi:hypothetical protein
MTISTASIKTTFLTISLKMENDYFQFSFSLKFHFEISTFVSNSSSCSSSSSFHLVYLNFQWVQSNTLHQARFV